ncbi:MAG: GNAT family N-acetyltransferase [Gammaproteobacteria bacterium]|nr:GNAT family N-acetyltransferase [Gammaproteobacteria bacterium]
MTETDSIIDPDMTGWGRALAQLASAEFCRLAVIVVGDDPYCRETAEKILSGSESNEVLWVSDTIAGALSPARSRTQLGQEYDGLVFDATSNFDIDAFGAVTGTLRGGGLLILLMPSSMQHGAALKSRFQKRLLPLLKNDTGIFLVQQYKPLANIPKSLHLNTNQRANCDAPFRTLEQQQLVQLIESVAIEQRHQPIVVISDRGRGKSSALGLAAGRLLSKQINNIIVTAPRLSISAPVFKHAQQVLPDARPGRGRLDWKQGCLKFVAPDALLLERPAADLLLVDEAAAIALPLLEQLLHAYPDIVFATTIHGYEGTGRGFALKFNKTLDRNLNQWHAFSMRAPVRWIENDPLEIWVDKLLCLDAELAAVPTTDAIDLDECKVVLINRDELIADAKKLSSLFALLVYAHYRTRPSDLKQLLDDERIRVYTLEYKQQVLAALLVNEEGGIDEPLCAEIYRGERRPNGHMLAQTLTFHAGSPDAATLNYARIMRIAVHPELHNRGMGSLLLRRVIECEQERVDAIGTSFGATTELIPFWYKAGFKTVRIGFTRDHASGTHSAIMLLPCSRGGEKVFNELRQRFQFSLSSWLSGPLLTMPSDVRDLIRDEQLEDVQLLSELDWQDIKSFATTGRGYEACMWPLKKLLINYPQVVDKLNPQSQLVIKGRIQDGLDWAVIAGLCGLKGRAAVIACLRGAVVEFLNCLPVKD